MAWDWFAFDLKSLPQGFGRFASIASFAVKSMSASIPACFACGVGCWLCPDHGDNLDCSRHTAHSLLPNRSLVLLFCGLCRFAWGAGGIESPAVTHDGDYRLAYHRHSGSDGSDWLHSGNTPRIIRSAQTAVARFHIFTVVAGTAVHSASVFLCPDRKNRFQWPACGRDYGDPVWTSAPAQPGACSGDPGRRMDPERTLSSLPQFVSTGGGTWADRVSDRRLRSRQHSSPHARWLGLPSVSGLGHVFFCWYGDHWTRILICVSQR